jgi:hypothetical protein
MADVAGSTPEQYALRVRTHPGVLQISASNKIRRAENVRISWSGRLIETYALSKNPLVIKTNLDNTRGLINSLGNGFVREENFYLWNHIGFHHISQFLSGFEVHDNLRSASPMNLLRFIDFKYNNNELQFWNVGLITKRQGTQYQVNESINISLILRTEAEKPLNPADAYLIRKSHIISPDDEFIDLNNDERARAREASIRLWREKTHSPGEPTRLNGDWVRNNIRKPNKVLLLVYFLDPQGAKLPADSNPIIGFAISFPGSDSDDAVTYAVHSQLLRNFDTEEVFDYSDDENDED